MINAIITDFDGTLVDTFEANFLAYQKAFADEKLCLTKEIYRKCFGYRYEYFVSYMGIFDECVILRIKENKLRYYPEYFTYLKPNNSLIKLIDTNHKLGVKTAIASTARKENLMNVINYLGIKEIFDLIYAGEDVKEGKPNPEIYIKTMFELGVEAHQTLIFEDSEVGLEAAIKSGANYLKITL